jgi:hypothetical protein
MGWRVANVDILLKESYKKHLSWLAYCNQINISVLKGQRPILRRTKIIFRMTYDTLEKKLNDIHTMQF